MDGCSGCWLTDYFRSSIGKKSLMAITGLGLFGFLVAHLAGNLQVFLPDNGKALNEYGHMLKSRPLVLWTARIGLLLTLITHVAIAIKLTLENKAARPIKYHVKNWREAGYAPRTMMISGPLILLYAIYHILHFTTGQAHPDFNPEDVYRNLIVAFRNPMVSAVYITAMVLLQMHLSHGLWSICQTLGINHPKYNRALRMGSIGVASALATGFISIPVAVLFGILR